ncbi:MAG: alpha/beta hydrolase [Gammaproteobacteria bacterium]|nr:alpha/beta hydrolase [Gammaproteobacteria bacterium]
MLIESLLKHALGAHPATQTPRLIHEISSVCLDDGVILQDYLAENRNGEKFIFTVANPSTRYFLSPVIAAHQTNEEGRKEVFSNQDNATLNYGLRLARRGHRVFGIDLRWTGERKTSAFWGFSAFCEQYPDWSPMGADCADFQDLIYLMQTYFCEQLPVNWIGHSHGGINGYILAATEPAGTFAHLVCNAAFLGLQETSDLDVLPNLGFYFRKDFGLELWYRLDELLEIASRKAFIKLNCYLSDQTLHYPIPTVTQMERFSGLEEQLILSMNKGGHNFSDDEQVRSAVFIEQPIDA